MKRTGSVDDGKRLLDDDGMNRRGERGDDSEEDADAGKDIGMSTLAEGRR